MNKLGKALLAVSLTFAVCTQAMAAFVLNGTRFIYEEGRKNTSFEVTNQSGKTYGGQVWIDNTTQGNGVYMVPAPPFFKLGAKQTQIIRIMKVDDALPKDRESLFWLNVQEVPPKPKESDGNVLSIAMNTQVKLIYRPTALQGSRENAEQRIQVITRDGKTWLKNPTPYYFALVSVRENGQEVRLQKTVTDAMAIFAPFSEVSLDRALSGKISVEAVNDWGGTQVYALN
ncbi:fimbrial chaperone [Salmonella enterica subsp. enterica serovar Montevideo]|nr:fimbrial chaperone [Salmonella enterica subsp. enterica serovar Montevideo]EEK7813090.1 fimbrial chaperone [Salmonella enterica subsp. enterica serovar Montevideo]